MNNKHILEIKNLFDAHFVDAACASLVIEGGNLLPTITNMSPKAGKLHLLRYPIISTLYRNTILVSRAIVKTNVEDDSGIEKVEFYVDEKLEYTDNEEPYDYSVRKVLLLKRILPHRHTIKVKA